MSLLGIFASQNYPRYVPIVLADNPIGFRLLNETTGSTGEDLTANNNDLTFYNSPTLGTSTGASGIPTSITFDGSDDRLQTSKVAFLKMPASSSWSMECWFKTSSSALGTLFAWRSDSGGSGGVTMTLDLNSSVVGRLRVATADSVGAGLIISNDGGYNDNVFHQVVVTAASGGALKLYVDSVEVASTSTARVLSNEDEFILLGANDSGGSTFFRFFNGGLAACSIYNTTLTTTQISNHYLAGL